MSDLVRLEVEDGIGTIRLDRPPMNALNAEIQHGRSRRRREAAERRDVAAVIVWGGEKVFAAGADIKEMETMSYTDMVDHSAPLQDFTRALARMPKPTVAAITGYALGGGCEVALALRLPRRGRRRAARPARDPARHHPRRRRHPAPRTPRRPGQGQGPRVLRPVRQGRRGARHRARRRGGAAAEVYAARAPGWRRYVGGPAYALRAAKEAIDRGLELDLETGLEIERMLFAGTFATKDRAVGMRHFVEKGKGPAPFEGA